ncbi:serine acetyltransferase [Bacteroidia bacterium]|nr:serine acetyltransferase [Bacteroidia bacterium]GHT60894.1 serine acetyltransferase [Bacteroidia bacterium]
MNRNKSIQSTVKTLTEDHDRRFPFIPIHERRLPSSTSLSEIIESIRAVIFPGYFGSPLAKEDSLVYHVGIGVEKIFNELSHQIFDALFFQSEKIDSDQTRTKARALTNAFLNRLQYIKQLMSSDVKAMFNSDPAAKNLGEVIFCYPAIKAITNYRISHELYLLDIPLIPRIITELAHAETGIDIHPGAEIGEYFSIDHGTGVVIGQTTIIGNHVTIYQGVTLGSKNFILDDAGRPKDIPRHPILEDHVTVYSNASILGRVTIGRGTIIGGNIWLDHSVPPYSRILQTKAVKLDLTDGAGI